MGVTIAQTDLFANCYHSQINRQQAETLLCQYPEGCFLVRDSNSSVGDFVLSVHSLRACVQPPEHEPHSGRRRIQHYRIHRHTDTLFSMYDREAGETAAAVTTPEDADGLFTLDVLLKRSLCFVDLRTAVPGGTHLPLRSGELKSRLLHRVIICADMRLLELLLQNVAPEALAQTLDCEQRTAIHLAVIHGHMHVLARLLAHTAPHHTQRLLRMRDTLGLCALHYAARHDRPRHIHALVRAGANVQARTHDGAKRVPLHEAASGGHIEAVRALLSLNAPLRPRDSEGRIPLEVAREAGHDTCCLLLERYREPLPCRVSACEWLHTPCVSRVQAERMLTQAGREVGAGGGDGCFLVRHSARRQQQQLVLSLLCANKCYHLRIEQVERQWDTADSSATYVYIDDGPLHESLEHLVHYYSHTEDGLACTLRSPVGPPQEMGGGHKPVPAARVTDTQSPAAVSVSAVPQITMEDLVVGELLGAGEFSRVYRGVLTVAGGGEKQQQVVVAVKTPSFYCFHGMRRNFHTHFYRTLPSSGTVSATGTLDDTDQSAKEPGQLPQAETSDNASDTMISMTNEMAVMLREANCLRQIQHPCIVAYLGIVYSPDGQLMIVQEYMPLGSLLAYLRAHAQQPPHVRRLLEYGRQVASGMSYLATNRIIHRDLAARNCLMCADTERVKISDFGFSLTLAPDTEEYVSVSGGRWPIKWYAPEAIVEGRFSLGSDLWSYAVLLWEIFSLGAEPYGALSGLQAFSTVIERGARMSQPPDCPQQLYDLMLQCWSYTVTERPSFLYVHNFLAQMLQDTSGNAHIYNNLATPLYAAEEGAVTAVHSCEYDQPRCCTVPRVPLKARSDEGTPTAVHPPTSRGRCDQLYESPTTHGCR